jgi:hypothetical protein
MLTESEDGSCGVQVTPVICEGDGYGNWWNFRRVSDPEAICKNGAFVYQVRQGAYIALCMENHGEMVRMDVVREEVSGETGQRSPYAMPEVTLSAGEIHDTKNFRMKMAVRVIDVLFTSITNKREVVLHMQFEGVAAADGGTTAPGGVGCLLTELLAHAT